MFKYNLSANAEPEWALMRTNEMLTTLDSGGVEFSSVDCHDRRLDLARDSSNSADDMCLKLYK